MAEKSRSLAAFLAIFLGIFGVHKLYLGYIKKGILYFIFCWTFVPALLGFYSGIKYLLVDEETFQRKYVKSRDGGGAKPTISETVQQDSSEVKSSAEEYLMKADGRNGQLTLFENKVRISRQGLISTLTNPFKGEKDIRIDDITSIQFRKPGKATAGFIQIGQSGYSESGDGLFDAASDENSVTFDKDDLDDFQRIREELEKRRSNNSTSDSAVAKLRGRFADGEITEEEYKKRKEILEE